MEQDLLRGFAGPAWVRVLMGFLAANTSPAIFAQESVDQQFSQLAAASLMTLLSSR
jgi:hypothetical protein